jgi:hypothetical protein
MFFKTSCQSLSKIWNMLRLTCYLVNLLIIKNSSFKDHLFKLEMVLARLSTAGMRLNIYNMEASQSTLSFTLLALTMIDPATGWFEIVKATNKSATSIQDLFHNIWLTCYPRPQFIVFDNGSMGKFKREFKKMCSQDNYGIKAKPTTSHIIPSTSKCNH